MPTDLSVGSEIKNTFAYACGCMACSGKSLFADASVSQTFDHARLDPATLISINLIPDTIATTADFTILDDLSESGGDAWAINLVAGQTYSFAMRGVGAGGVVDPLLAVYGPDGAGYPFIEYDDDGGAGITALYTITPEVSGEYVILATSYFGDDPGAYQLDVWVAGADSVPNTLAGAVSIDVGTTYGHLETSGDRDLYKVELVAGKYYQFELAGGADYRTDYENVPAGELDTILGVFNQSGGLIASNDDLGFPSDISSGLGFLATYTGTYYVQAGAYSGQTGGYTLDVVEINLADYDPVDSIRWLNADNIDFGADNIAYVYFGDSDENFNQTADNGVDPMITFDWNAYEKQQIMVALEEYEKILGVDYQVTTDLSQATFRLLKAESTQYGAYFFPDDDAFGADQGVGVFNILSGGWSFDQQQSLVRGGFSFGVVLHEFGHAHGLAHPHDGGGGSDVMLGVAGSAALGVFNLNQGVYTVMSYNDAWQLHPDGPSPYTGAGIDNGWSGSLSAFDIAALQERYGVHDYATGNTVYQLKNVNDQGTFYQTIWDTGGTDEIRYDGNRDAQIDLLAATLDYSATGGGVVSFVDGIWGGYTIANGVTIENARSGNGDDVLLGNSANNLLIGNNGDDLLMGRAGNDSLEGGNGDDILNGGAGNDLYTGGGGVDTYVFEEFGTVETIDGYQKGEKIDLSAFGLAGGEITITKKGIFVDADDNGSFELTIWVNGPQVQLADVILI